MSYRDDREADRARIAALELELSATKLKLATLEGRQSQALALASQNALAVAPGSATRWFGAPGSLSLARQFTGAFPAERFEHLVERIRELTLDPGRTELFRSSMTWLASRGEKSAGPFRVVTVAVRDGQTTLTVSDRLTGLAGAIYGGVGGGVGGGALALPLAASAAVPALAPVFILGWLGGVFLGARAIFKRAARRRAIALQQLFDALVADIEAALSAP
ncbi:MAG TPA: hypothetical protein VFP84_36560 [Kofleriaceae bacterium]|nr:hypothetical protein [Kofleriaceae bacterium]